MWLRAQMLRLYIRIQLVWCVVACDCRFTDTLPPGAYVTVAPLQLTRLFDDPYMPFPDISWAYTAEGLLQVRAWHAGDVGGGERGPHGRAGRYTWVHVTAGQHRTELFISSPRRQVTAHDVGA